MILYVQINILCNYGKNFYMDVQNLFFKFYNEIVYYIILYDKLFKSLKENCVHLIHKMYKNFR